jgi:hypothetical protein
MDNRGRTARDLFRRGENVRNQLNDVLGTKLTTRPIPL